MGVRLKMCLFPRFNHDSKQSHSEITKSKLPQRISVDRGNKAKKEREQRKSKEREKESGGEDKSRETDGESTVT